MRIVGISLNLKSSTSFWDSLSTNGMEGNITNIFQNLQKNEQIQNKEGMGKTRFEREVKARVVSEL